MSIKKIITSVLVLSSLSGSCYAGETETLLSQLQGYTILGALFIDGWVDPDGKHGDSFEGCTYGRKIIFSGNKALTCSNYHYHYAYRPEAVILSYGGMYKMIVDDEVYDMTNQQ